MTDPVRRRIHPVRWLVRLLILALGAAVVAAFAWWQVGPPSLARVYRQDEIARFHPTVGHGVGQFLGETFLLVLVACVARRWLKVRL